MAQGILRNPYDATKVFLIYANVTEEDILLRKEFDAWARDHRARFKVWQSVIADISSHLMSWRHVRHPLFMHASEALQQ